MSRRRRRLPGMNILGAVLGTAGLAVGGALDAAAAAPATSSACVDRATAIQLEMGTRKREVREEFGLRGQRTARYSTPRAEWMARIYPLCEPGHVNILYRFDGRHWRAFMWGLSDTVPN